MANTVINLSDAISQLVTKINTISSHVSDVATLTTTDKSNLVAAINELDAAAISLSSSGTMTNKTINLAFFISSFTFANHVLLLATL